MAAIASFFYYICLIWLQLIALNAAENQPPVLHKNESSSKPGRFKRDLLADMPNTIVIKMKYLGVEIIDLNFVKTEQYIANKYLPVDLPLGEVHANINVMENVGEFVMYRDLEKCAAIVYFGKTKTIFGVIGMDYYIQNLPYELHQNGVYMGFVQNPYVVKRDDESHHNYPNGVIPPIFDINIPGSHMSNPSNKRPSESEADQSSKRHGENTRYSEHLRHEAEFKVKHMNGFPTAARHRKFYLETLVFISRDITKLFMDYFHDTYIEWIIRYYLIYFNAVDMHFQKIRGYELERLHINIAKIVIEDDLLPFNFMNDGELRFAEIVTKLPQYLEIHSHDYTPDSFDHIFVFTRRPIIFRSTVVPALTKLSEDLYEARKTEKKFYDVVPITVMGFKFYHADYFHTIKELGRVLTLDVDPPTKGLKPTGAQCYGIMQKGGPKCNNCLEWSTETRDKFNAFIGVNRNRCFLLNQPRSLLSPGPKKLITPYNQCQCYGFELFFSKRAQCGQQRIAVRNNDCMQPLECSKNDGELIGAEFTVRPFDGTTCGRRKVCWRGECEKIVQQGE